MIWSRITTNTTLLPPSGSRSFAEKDLFVTARWIPETYRTWIRKTSWDLTKCIFLQGSERGVIRYALRDGPTTEKCGRQASPVNHSPSPDNASSVMILGTCTRTRTILSRSADLQYYLGNKLRQLHRINGSTLYRYRWSTLTLPRGWQFSRLVASQVPRTCDNASTGLPKTLQANWNSPGAMDGHRGAHSITMDTTGKAHRISKTTGTRFGMTLVTQSQLSKWPNLTGWQSPVSRGGSTDAGDAFWREANRQIARFQNKEAGLNIMAQASMTAWPRPVTRDYKDTGKFLFTTSSMVRKNGKLRLDSIPRIVALTAWPNRSAWPSPTAQATGAGNMETNPRGIHSSNAMATAAVSTHWDPVQTVLPKPIPKTMAEVTEGPARVTADMILVIGSTVETGTGDRLNPGLSRWLMGVPKEWDDCVDMVTRSSSGKLLRSSNRSFTPKNN